MSVSSACDVGGETKDAVSWEDTPMDSTSFGTSVSVLNVGGDAYEVCPNAPPFSASAMFAANEGLFEVEAPEYGSRPTAFWA